MLHWPILNSGAIQALASVFTLAVTGVLAIITWRYVRLTKDLADVARAQLRGEREALVARRRELRTLAAMARRHLLLEVAQLIERLFAPLGCAMVLVAGLFAGALIQYWRERVWFRLESFDRFRRELNEKPDFVAIKRKIQDWANLRNEEGYEEEPAIAYYGLQSCLTPRGWRRILRFLCALVITGLIAVSVATASESPLTKLAAAKFPNLTRCERAVLGNADIKTTGHAPPAACGPSSKFEDPSNDPKNAATWDHQRELRAELIRWVFVDPDANKLVDPAGIEALGARITGSLNLGFARAPFVLGCVHCAIAQPMGLEGAELNALVLSGSYTNSINAGGSHIHNGVYLDDGFKASGLVSFGNSRIDSDFNCSGGSFTHGAAQDAGPWADEKPALFLGVARIQGPVWLTAGFKADGAVDINGITCDSVLCSGGRFFNPGNRAIVGWGVNVSGAVMLAGSGPLGAIEATGLVQFDNAKIGGLIYASGAKFLGSPSEIHGFSASAMTSAGVFLWQNITLQNGATLDLRGATVNGLIDDEASWPAPGRLAIDGFVYHDFYGGPVDAASRLKWVNLGVGQHPPWLVVASGFHSQPYRELAKVLRDRGDDAGAAQVLIAEEDARYSQHGIPGRAVGGFIKWTIGYGHRPLLALLWSLAVVLIGSAAVSIGKRAGVMAPTWPENKPPDARKSYEELQPLLYSLDAFLPFVDLHQEHYWWPDATATGECALLGRRITVRGRALRYYLWMQIVAGWLLSAIFIAGITGLLRSD